MFAEGDWDDTASAESLIRSASTDCDKIKEKVSQFILSNIRFSATLGLNLLIASSEFTLNFLKYIGVDRRWEEKKFVENTSNSRLRA